MGQLPVAEIVTLLQSLGTWGVLLVSLVVGLALAVIVYARSRNLFAETTATKQATDFQAKLLEALAAISKSETALRVEVDELQKENAGLRDKIGELTASVDLMRNQNRHVIDLLRDVMKGRLAPDAITPADIEGA